MQANPPFPPEPIPVRQAATLLAAFFSEGVTTLTLQFTVIPTSGLIRDFNPIDNAHTRHTRKAQHKGWAVLEI